MCSAAGSSERRSEVAMIDVCGNFCAVLRSVAIPRPKQAMLPMYWNAYAELRSSTAAKKVVGVALRYRLDAACNSGVTGAYLGNHDASA